MAALGAADEVCVPNISPPERRKRLVGGAIQLALAVLVLVAMEAAGIERAWRLLLFPVFFGAAAGFFQWYDRT